MGQRSPGRLCEYLMSAPEFDPAERAKEVAAATKRRETIAEDVERLMAKAKRQGWGELLNRGLPTFQGGLMVYHFESGDRGYVRLPLDTDYGNKET